MVIACEVRQPRPGRRMPSSLQRFEAAVRAARPRLLPAGECGITVGTDAEPRSGNRSPRRPLIMARFIKLAAAQMGPNNEGTSREEIVERMLGLLDQAIAERVELIA